MKRSDILKLRKIIEEAVQSLADETALQAVTLYPAWTENTVYVIGFKVQYNNKLYKCLQRHTSLTGWEPVNSASLWEEINETHEGTQNDPIPYDGNMVLMSGLYYIQNEVVYLCTRDTVNPVYNALNELIGIYVEEV